MGAQTRSSASNSPLKQTKYAKPVLPSAEAEPHQLIVLPSQSSPDARFLWLRSPRDGTRNRYYLCPERGLFEFTRVKASGREYRSIFLAPEDGRSGSEPIEEDTSTDAVTISPQDSCHGYVNESSEIFLATPFDPVFILLPLLDQPTSNAKTGSSQGLFQPIDDLLDEPVEDDSHLCQLMTDPVFRPKLLNAVKQICDSVDGGDEQVYRLSILKLYDYLFKKAQRVVEKGLPASLEDRFVTRALEGPIPSMKRAEDAESLRIRGSEVVNENPTSDANSEHQTGTTAIEAASVGAAGGIVGPTLTAHLHYLQRLRVAMSFITSSYLNPSLAARLKAASDESRISPDFGPLDTHSQELTRLRAEALATLSLSNFSRKRGIGDDGDDEITEARAEKKRKQEEEKMKKKQESRGVRDLKKVNVMGMKKMSDFFTRMAPTAMPKS